jgi:tetratricopeptide (TPR) repeat protein
MRQENGPRAAPPAGDSTARALEEYLAAAEAGTAPPREEFLAGHPGLAEDLDACLEALRFIGRAVAGPRALAADIAQAQPPEPAAGQLGDFRLLREVGRGGMGVVYEAEQISLARRVALKVLPFAATMDPRQLQRFHNEARAAASLDHPHIVHVHAIGCERAVHFYAMQFIDGQTLAQVIADCRLRIADSKKEVRSAPGPAGGAADVCPPTGPYTPEPAAQSTISNPQTAIALTPPVAAISTERGTQDRAYFRGMAELGIQAAEALDHAHALGVIHRDVKPANLLVDGSGKLWVTDFGLAHIQSDARLTMTGDLVGTLRYMSPEQALAKRIVVDHRTDVYSLGATLYELLTLEPAFGGSDRQELLRQIAFEEPKAPRRVNKAMPAELETIVQKAMEKNPADRYATAKELADDLRRFLADEPIRARPASLVRRLRKWSRRHRAAVRAATALVLAVLVLGGMVLWREMGQRAAVEHSVEAALDRAELLQQEERLDEALAVLVLAQGQLEDRGLEAMRQRVEESRRDVQMLKKLEQARLQEAASGQGTSFDHAGANRLYTEAFEEYGLDVTTLDPGEAVKRIRASAICDRLIAALDYWAFVRNELRRGDGDSVRAVADLANDDPWRRQVFEAAKRGDLLWLEVLAQNVQEEGTLNKPAATLTLFAMTLRNLGSLATAERLLRQVQAERPADFWINFDLATILSLKKPADWAEAIRFCQAAVALRPQSAVAHGNLGAALYNRGDVDGAIAEGKKAIELDPSNAVARSNLGVALHNNGDVDGAIAECKTAIKLRPNSADAHFHLANALYAKNGMDEAIAEYRIAIDIDCKHAGAHSNLGAALHKKGDLSAAIAECKKAIDFEPMSALTHSNLGNVLRDKKDVDAAIAECRKAVELDPKLADAHLNLALALGDKGDQDEAIAEYRKAIDLKKNSAKAHYNLGVTLREKRDVDGAIAEYRKAIRIKPDHVEAHLNLGAALSDKGRLDDAIAEFREAIRIKPDYAEAHNNLGNGLRDKGRADMAINAYDEAIRLSPGFAAAHTNLGGALHDKGQLDDAIAKHRVAIRIKPEFAQAHYNLGNALRDKGELDKAIAEFRAALSIKPDYAEAHNNLGNALQRKGRLDEAIAEYREAMRLKKDDAEPHNGLGTALRKKGDVDAAISEFRAALRIKPDYAKAHSNLGNALRDKGRLDDAIADFRKAVAIDPNCAPAHNNLGNALKEKGRTDEAIAEYRAAIQIKPDFAEAHTNLGVALRDKGRLNDAIAEFRKAILIKPDFAEPHYNLANVLYGKGQLDEAVGEYRKALRFKPDYADAHSNLGNSLRDKGRLDEAIAEYRKAIAIDPKYAPAYSNLGGALSEKGRLDQAIAEYRKAIRIKPDNAEVHLNLGLVLVQKRDVEQAIGEFRQALQLKPDNASALHSLGDALVPTGRASEAEKSYRQALAIRQRLVANFPDNADHQSNVGATLNNLAQLLGRQAKCVEARALSEQAIRHQQAALKINAKHPTYRRFLRNHYTVLTEALLGLGEHTRAAEAAEQVPRFSSTAWQDYSISSKILQHCIALAQKDGKLSVDERQRLTNHYAVRSKKLLDERNLLAVVDGKSKFLSNVDKLAVAAFCQTACKQLYVASVRLYTEAFAAQPELEDKVESGHRYNAARAAALAGCGQGEDAAKLDDKEKRRLRDQALAWLRADLDSYDKQYKARQVPGVILLIERLAHAQKDPNFKGIRESLATLPDSEQLAWRKLWADMEQLLKQAGGSLNTTRLQGNLKDESHQQTHDHKLEAGIAYVIDMRSAAFDTYLKLLDAKGTLIADNDDIAPNDLNSRIIFTPKESGTFRIVATSYQERGRGPYTLTITWMKQKAGDRGSP